MKKLLVALLALAIVGGAFAQTVSVSTSGTVTLLDQTGNSTFARDGSGYDLLTFKGADKDGKWSYSATLDNFDNNVSPFTTLRDWTATYNGSLATIKLGKVRNGDFRTAVANGYIMGVGASRRFFNGAAYGVIVEKGFGPLTLGLGLPVSETASDAVKTTFEKTNIGVKYATDGLTFKGLAMLDLTGATGATNTIGLGVDFTQVKGLEVIGFANIYAASTSSYNGGVEVIYTGVDKLTGVVDFEYVNSGTASTYNFAAHADYALMDNVTASAELDYLSTNQITFFAKGTYDLGGGVNASLKAGYDTVDNVIYALAVGYSISF